MQELDHKHLVVTAAIKNPPRTEEEIKQWLLKVVAAADMKVFMNPMASRCDTLGNEGVTGIVGLETSHASIHVWETASVPFLKFDIYSCKRFDPQSILDCMMEFEPYYFQTMLIDRNDTIEVADKSDIQVASIIDMLSDSEKQHYLSGAAKRRKKEKLSVEEKAANVTYNKFAHKFSIKTTKRLLGYKKDHSQTIGSIKSRCNKKGLDFDLTKDWYESEFQKSKIKWSKLTIHGSDDSFWRADVDRIDPSHGYTQNNCRIIPHALNVAKWKWHGSELETLAELLNEEVKKES